MNKTKNEVTWHCVTCDKTMDQKEFFDHIKTYHNIQETKGTRQMTAHMDGQDWFSTTYEWTIGANKFIQSVVCERAKDDMMRYM